MHLDSNPSNARSIVAVGDTDELTLRSRDILIDSEGQIVTVASHGLLPSCSDLHILGVVGVYLRDLTTLFDRVSGEQSIQH
jgi:hypothetical protein